MPLNAKSIERLTGVHEALQRVIKRADTGLIQFQVTEGLRTVERQAQLIKEGKSQLKDPKMGRHCMGLAVDLVVSKGIQITWEFRDYKALADVIKQAALAENVTIIWGGDWITFKDGPHFELPLTYKKS